MKESREWVKKEEQKRKEEEKGDQSHNSKRRRTQEQEDWESDFWNSEDMARRDIKSVDREDIIDH
eukprot:240250-Karenia_brevis.AAC.1